MKRRQGIMEETAIKERQITTLKEFYGLMAETRTLRSVVVRAKFEDLPVRPDWINSFEGALLSLEQIPKSVDKVRLQLDDQREIETDISYEINELKKDIFYLQKGEKAFMTHLSTLHQDFTTWVEKGMSLIKDLQFNCFITDRDGTINNCCARYQTSVQSIYNAVFLTRFAMTKTTHPMVITSAPLADPGIVDVSVNPEKRMIYAASKGREFIDLSGNRRTYPIDEEKQQKLNHLNDELRTLVNKPGYEKFTLIGSGLQLNDHCSPGYQPVYPYRRVRNIS